MMLMMCVMVYLCELTCGLYRSHFVPSHHGEGGDPEGKKERRMWTFGFVMLHVSESSH